MRTLSPIRLERDIHCLTIKLTNLFLFSFDDNRGLHCLIYMFRKSFCILNSPEERLFLSTSFIELLLETSKTTSVLFNRFPFDKEHFNKLTANAPYVDFKGLNLRNETSIPSAA